MKEITAKSAAAELVERGVKETREKEAQRVSDEEYLLSGAYRARMERFARDFTGDYGITLMFGDGIYTTGKLIVINPLFGPFGGDPLTIRMAANRGTVFHEGFHNLYTDFEVLERMAEKYGEGTKRYRIRHSFLNIIEDPAVEMFGCSDYPGAIPYIRLINERMYRAMPALEETERAGNRIKAFQVACWQHATFGEIKGSFEAEDMLRFWESAKPLLEQGREAKTTKERAEASEELCEAIAPLVTEAEQRHADLMEQAKGLLSHLGKGQNRKPPTDIRDWRREKTVSMEEAKRSMQREEGAGESEKPQAPDVCEGIVCEIDPESKTVSTARGKIRIPEECELIAEAYFDAFAPGAIKEGEAFAFSDIGLGQIIEASGRFDGESVVAEKAVIKLFGQRPAIEKAEAGAGAGEESGRASARTESASLDAESEEALKDAAKEMDWSGEESEEAEEGAPSSSAPSGKQEEGEPEGDKGKATPSKATEAEQGEEEADSTEKSEEESESGGERRRERSEEKNGEEPEAEKGESPSKTAGEKEEKTPRENEAGGEKAKEEAEGFDEAEDSEEEPEAGGEEETTKAAEELSRAASGARERNKAEEGQASEEEELSEEIEAELFEEQNKTFSEILREKHAEEQSLEREEAMKGFFQNERYEGIHSHIDIHSTDRFEEAPGEYEKIRAGIAKIASSMGGKIKNAIRFNEEEKAYGRTHGRLSANQLWRRDEKIFHETKNKSTQADLAILVLVDESGSMHQEGRYLHAQKAAALFAEVCEQTGTALAVMGHTARYGKPIAEIRHYIRFERPIASQKKNLCHIKYRQDNRDGLAYRYAFRYLLQQPQEDKILIVISDGKPAHQDGKGYAGIIAAQDCLATVEEFRRKGVTAIGVAIGEGKDSIASFFEKHISIPDVERLPEKLVRILERSIFKD